MEPRPSDPGPPVAQGLAAGVRGGGRGGNEGCSRRRCFLTVCLGGLPVRLALALEKGLLRGWAAELGLPRGLSSLRRTLRFWDPWKRRARMPTPRPKERLWVEDLVPTPARPQPPPLGHSQRFYGPFYGHCNGPGQKLQGAVFWELCKRGAGPGPEYGFCH